MAPGIPTPQEWKLNRAIQLRDFLLEEFEFSSRTHRLLRQNGVTTIGELVTMTDAELMAIPGIGPWIVADIEEVLGWDGLELGMKLPD